MLLVSLTAVAVAAGDSRAQMPAEPRQTDGTTAAPEIPAAADDLTPEVLYRILVGDVAMQRGDAALAARAYFEAARESRDPVLARRATEIALFARQRTLALEAAKLWQQLDPKAERARQMVASLAISGAGSDLKGELQRVLIEAAANDKSLGEAFLQLNQALAAQTDKVAAFRLVQDLARPYPKVPEAWFAVALAGYNTKLTDPAITAAAMTAVDRALELKPGWDRAALIKADILAKGSPDAAIAFLKQFLATAPDARAVAGALAQIYVEQKRFGDARAIFQQMWDEEPEDREFEFAVAAISLQMKDYATAQRLLDELDKVGYGDKGVVPFYLAQLAEETKRYDEAIARYREVTEGDRAWLAKLRIGAMIAKKGDIAAARSYLDGLKPESAERRVELAQAEAQLLRDAGDYKSAYAVLTEALERQADSVDLLYDVAMVAEKLDRIDEVESRLKRLIQLKPDNAQALNALGYTLVDRTPRTAEGLKLIEKALQIAPDDPFILDSMGWANYRLGKLDDSEKFLRRAFGDQADPEIAAHLGEVLWAKGERERATELWQSQLRASPDNPVLIETMRRLAH
ncbi:MAG TPA: tetratricopeptide repeat protein [Casimicrobiaceae bacterium]|nr:tetratricopeptide repeat protein [Casimicrobiaceae bacterium]